MDGENGKLQKPGGENGNEPQNLGENGNEPQNSENEQLTGGTSSGIVTNPESSDDRKKSLSKREKRKQASLNWIKDWTKGYFNTEFGEEFDKLKDHLNTECGEMVKQELAAFTIENNMNIENIEEKVNKAREQTNEVCEKVGEILGDIVSKVDQVIDETANEMTNKFWQRVSNSNTPAWNNLLNSSTKIRSLEEQQSSIISMVWTVLVAFVLVGALLLVQLFSTKKKNRKQKFSS